MCEIRGMEKMADVLVDVLALIDLLGLEPVCVEKNHYGGVTIVQEWNPNFRCVYIDCLWAKQWLVHSKHQFPGAFHDLDGTWVLRI